MAHRIIVADDLPNVTKALKLMLSPYYEVVEAFSGTDVLDYCEEQRIDGVLLDLRFESGGMNGFDTAELLRVNFPEVKIVLFSSGDYSSEERSRALEIGAEFLPKPVELAQVRRIFG